jgi:hypothetical protein
MFVRGLMLLFAFLATGLPVASIAGPLSLVDQGQNTYDPNTGLSWLDVSVTLGLSHEDVAQSLIGPSQPYAGYRFATADDLFALLADANVDVGTRIPADPNLQPLNNLLGPVPFLLPNINEVVGIFSRSDGSFSNANFIYESARSQVFVEGQGDLPPNYHHFEIGSFLVTPAPTAVPGPIVGAGLPGLLAACAVLVALARRRRESGS